MKSTRNLCVASAMLLLVGCGTTSSPCGKVGDYMEAQSAGTLVIPEGLERPPEYRRVDIPAGADVVHPELRGQMVMTADGSLRCLDRPPPARGIIQ